MLKQDKREVWQRGPLENIPPLLQPVAHALLQASEEVEALMIDFQQNLIWNKPAGVASVAFHLQHLAGVLDRLFTYARNEQLSNDQLNYLQQEGIRQEVEIHVLVKRFCHQVTKALDQLSQTGEQILSEVRGVGRAQIPSTIIGLLVHAAEHTMRHVGQLHVTVKMLQAGVVE